MDFEILKRFVRIWWESATLRGAAGRMGMGVRRTANLAIQLRAAGVPMKYMTGKFAERFGLKLTDEERLRLQNLGTELQLAAAVDPVAEEFRRRSAGAVRAMRFRQRNDASGRFEAKRPALASEKGRDE